MLKQMKRSFKGIGEWSLIVGQYPCILAYNSTVHSQYHNQKLENTKYFQKTNIVGLQMQWLNENAELDISYKIWES